MQVPCGACGQMIAAQMAGPPPAQPAWQQPAPSAPPGPFAGGTGAPPMASTPAAATPPPAQSAGPVVKVQLPYGIKIPIKVGGGGFGFKIIGFVVFAIVASVAVFIVKSKLKGETTAKGNLSYKDVGLDPKHPAADELVAAVRGTATRWHKDAVWWSINLQQVHADGTVDSSAGGNEVVFISEGGVASNAKSVRDDSIKKFHFGPAGIDHKDKWGATDPWEDVVPPAKPACGLKDLMEKQLSKRGITGDKTVRISLDPDDYGVWHVWGDVDSYFSPEDCSELKKE